MMAVRKAVLGNRRTMKELDEVLTELKFRKKGEKYKERTPEQIVASEKRAKMRAIAEQRYLADRAEKLKGIHLMPDGPGKTKMLEMDAATDKEWRRVAAMPDTPKKIAAEFFISEKADLAREQEILTEIPASPKKTKALELYQARAASLDKVAKMPWGKAKEKAIEAHADFVKSDKYCRVLKVEPCMVKAVTVAKNATVVKLATALMGKALAKKAQLMAATVGLKVGLKMDESATGPRVQNGAKPTNVQTENAQAAKPTMRFVRAYELLQMKESKDDPGPRLSPQQQQLLEQQREHLEFRLRAGKKKDDVASCMLTLKESIKNNKQTMLAILPVLNGIHASHPGIGPLSERAKHEYHPYADKRGSPPVIHCVDCKPDFSIHGMGNNNPNHKEVVELGKGSD